MILKGNFRARDDVLLAINQDRYMRQEAYGILVLSMMLRDKQERDSAALFVKNVLDDSYVSSIGSQN